MKLVNYIIPVLLLSYSCTCTAKIYQWTDSNGVTQFSQTPPSMKSKKQKIKVKEVKQHIKSSQQVDEKGYVCEVLNVKQFSDKLKLLGHLRYYLSDFESRYIEALSNYQKELKSSSYNSISRLKYYKTSAENYKCMTKWSKKTIAKMEPLRLQYIKDLAEAKEKLDFVESGTPSRHPHYNEYRNKYHKLRGKKQGLIKPLKDLVH